MNNINRALEIIQEICQDKSHVIFLLRGEIGAGKTFLVARFIESIGISEAVTSPTFNLMHKYGENFYHYDLFNRDLSEVLGLGLLDLLEKNGVHFVEWGGDELFKILENAFNCVKIITIKERDGARIYHIY